MALMNYLEAEDDPNGPVLVEVGAIKGSGKIGDKGKRGYGKGKCGKSFGKYDKINEHSKNDEYGKGHERGKDKGKTGKGNGQGKDERPARNSSCQGYYRSCGKWGVRRASAGKVTLKEWRRFRLLPRVQWRRVQRPHLQRRRWCSDTSVNDKEKAYLQDILQRRIPSNSSRVVPLELWGPEGRVQCKVMFDVSDVAYPVLPLGKMMESGVTFSFNDCKCHMHKGNKRVDIFQKAQSSC